MTGSLPFERARRRAVEHHLAQDGQHGNDESGADHGPQEAAHPPTVA